MGLYRDETGRVIDIDDRFAEARGYTPVSATEENALYQQKGIEARGTERGIVGSVNALATGALSGLTLGGSDVLLSNILPPLELERMRAEIEAHPTLRAGGEFAGALGGALIAPLARTPTGYLSGVAQREVEAGLAAGGVRGTAKALAAMGGEGAVQSAGQYIGHASLEDKEITAEGLTGALGTGFTFGTVGGGAVLGISGGLMAGRKLFSRVMGGEKAAADAASKWTLESQAALESDAATLRAAETKLENIGKAKREAQRARNEARSAAQEASVDARAARPAPQAADFEAGIPTDVRPAPEAPPPEIGPTDPNFPRDAQGGMPTSVFNSPEALAAKAEAAKPPAGSLEEKLAGTKAQLDEGAALKDIGEKAVPGSPVKPTIPPRGEAPIQPGREPIPSIQDWLAEKASFDNGAADLSFAKKLEDIRGARGETGLDRMRARSQETLSEIRYKTTEDLLGPQLAKEEQRVADIVDEYKAAKADFDEIVAGADFAPAETPGTVKGGPGNRKAIEILDNAHEEALLRAKHAADPQEAGQAISEADQLEKLLEGLATPRIHAPDQPMSAGELRSPHSKAWADELAANASKVSRYEKASAALADEMAAEAHPVSTARAKAVSEADKDATRKLYDRSARATDDVDINKPSESQLKAKALRKEQIRAQAKLDELKVQHEEARSGYGAAKKKVAEGERAKKGALREDAQLARAGAKVGVGAQDVGSILEMIDIPGLPKPSDLPVVGPLLGAYLKFRTLKKALGRAMGKVPATADARVAALASQTRDRVARAVDRSIGVAERTVKPLVKALPPVAGILAHRIFDDGREDPKTSDIQALAAARMRELTAYVHTPGAIENDVRRQLAMVSDPDVIAAAEKQHRAGMEYLLSISPPMPERNILNPVEYRPAGAQAMSFARSLEAVNNPAGVFERLAHEQAMLSFEAAEALRKVYPRLFSEAGARLMERAGEGTLKVPMRQRVQLSLLYKVPLDSSMDPVNLQITQSVYDRKPPMPPPGAPAQATPSIANPVNISQQMTTAIDRR